jgi:hypothetical protein
MTLNVLRDEDGNMMSLIKYWNGDSSKKEVTPPSSETYSLRRPVPVEPVETEELVLEEKDEVIDLFSEESNAVETILETLLLNQPHLGWYYKRGFAPLIFFRWLYELLTRNGIERFGACGD